MVLSVKTTGSLPHRKDFDWAELQDDALLGLGIRDLGLTLSGTWLKKPINQLLRELREKKLVCKPHFWLSDEWFTPDGVPGIAIPFYLAHPRLMELEKRQMLEVEGGTHEGCMKILRHEMGHVLDNAYRIHRRAKYRQLFGRFGQEYPEYYRPRPYSKRFVLHLDSWYAQAHPAEDFAETFAVWMTPGSKWRTRYQGWAALKKLEYVNELMVEIADKPPPVQSRERVASLRSNSMTLAEHYEKKRAKYGDLHPDFYDRDLRRLFSSESNGSDAVAAAKFLRKARPELRRTVARWTGEYQYTIDQVLKEMIERCQTMKLWVDGPLDQTKLQAMVLLTVQTMNYLHSGRHRVAL